MREQKGTFEVVIVDRDHFGVAFAASRTIAEVDLFHDLDERIFAQIELGHAKQCLSILREQEFVVLLFLAAVESDGQGVIVGKFARFELAQNDLDAGWNGVKSPHLLLDPPSDLREGRIGRSSPDKPAEAQVWHAAKTSLKTACTLD